MGGLKNQGGVGLFSVKNGSGSCGDFKNHGDLALRES